MTETPTPAPRDDAAAETVACTGCWRHPYGDPPRPGAPSSNDTCTLAPAPPGGDDTETFTRVPMRPMTDAEEAADVWDGPAPGGDDGAAAARFALRNTVGAHDPEAVAYVAGLIRARDAALAEAARARTEVERLTAIEAKGWEEAARLAAALGRVEALCEEAEKYGDDARIWPSDLRTALSDAGTDEGRQGCGCPVNIAGDIRCHVCVERVNVRCWKCGTPRGDGPCPTAGTDETRGNR